LSFASFSGHVRLPPNCKAINKDNRNSKVPHPTSSAGKIQKGQRKATLSQPTHQPDTSKTLAFLTPPTSLFTPFQQGFDRIHEAYTHQQHNTPKQPNPKQALGYQHHIQTQTPNQPKQQTQSYAFSQPSKTNR